jgi:hypothetical protein
METGRRVLVRDYPQGEGRVVRVEVSYSKGGLNYFTYKDDPRGYWLHIQPMRIEVGDGFTACKYNPRDGHRMFLQEAMRFSASGMRCAVQTAEMYLETNDAVKTRVAYAAGALAQPEEV